MDMQYTTESLMDVVSDAVAEHGEMQVWVSERDGTINPMTGWEVKIMRDEINVPILILAPTSQFPADSGLEL
jgi:hypothetical protein